MERHLAKEDANDPGSPSHWQSNPEHTPALGPLSRRTVSRSVGEVEMMELKAMTGNLSDSCDSSDAEDSDPGGFWVQLLASAACLSNFRC